MLRNIQEVRRPLIHNLKYRTPFNIACYCFFLLQLKCNNYIKMCTMVNDLGYRAVLL